MPMALPTDIQPGGPHKGQELGNCSGFHQNSATTLLHLCSESGKAVIMFFYILWQTIGLQIQRVKQGEAREFQGLQVQPFPTCSN